MEVQRRKNGEPDKRYKNIDNEELKCLFETGMYYFDMAKQMNVSVHTIRDHLKKLGLQRIQKHTITNPNAFATPNEKNSYWGGFIAADGFVLSGRTGFGIDLAIKDESHLKKICKFIGRDEILRYRNRERDGEIFKYACISIISAKMLLDLTYNFSIVPKKSLILRPPPNLPQRLLSHFIRGFFDGDGCVCWDKNNTSIRLIFSSGSKNFLIWVKDIIYKEVGDFGPRKLVSKKKSKTKNLEFSGDNAIQILEWMYKDCNEEFYLDRKFIAFRKFRDRLYENRAKRVAKRQAIVQEMINLYKQGLSYRDISKALDTTIQRVTYYLTKTDIPKRVNSSENIAGQKIKARDQEILAAYLAGESSKSLAVKFGLAGRTVRAAIRRTKNLNAISQNT